MGIEFRKVVRWVEAQRHVLQVWEERCGGFRGGSGPPVWMHVASVGEYEQGLPVIEALRERGIPVVVTFFSPSGEQILADAAHRGVVAWYLPFGGQSRVQRWLDSILPRLALFIRYEHWLPYLRALRSRGIPVFNVAAYFRGQLSWVKRWWYRTVLPYYTRVLVQDSESAQVAQEVLGLPLDKVVVVGDPRVDRVLALRREKVPQELQERLRVWISGPYRLIIVGSSYTPEEKMLAQIIRCFRDRSELSDLRWVVVPHVVEEGRLDWWVRHSGVRAIRYSRLGDDPGVLASYEVLLVDRYGLLKYIYRYGVLAVVGGGFNKQIHSVLEPIVWRLPVLVGPRLGSSREAWLLRDRALWVFHTANELQAHIIRLLSNHEYQRAQSAIDAFLVAEQGAVARILQQLTPWLSTT